LLLESIAGIPSSKIVGMPGAQRAVTGMQGIADGRRVNR
jgi:hypothetical protein